MATRLMIGAMSGTSADGIDVALVAVSGRGLAMTASLRRHLHLPYRSELRRAICTLRQAGGGSFAELAGVGREISLVHADAVNALLEACGHEPQAIEAIAAHGQTLFHAPPDTIQWLDPALVASRTGCRVISDFRRADCAAGGQGAPLVPFADYILFRDRRRSRVLLNIGGIANLTFLQAGASIDQLVAFDTGPGNCISDHLMRRHDPAGPGFDYGGQLALSGAPVEALAADILASPWFSHRPPKSTDGPAMIALFTESAARIDREPGVVAPSTTGAPSLPDLLATACAITARSILSAIAQWLPAGADELIVSGGGSENEAMMRMLSAGGIPVRRLDDLGVPSAAKEAMAFALLGAATLDGVPSNVPAATGASRAVVLGSLSDVRSGTMIPEHE